MNIASPPPVELVLIRGIPGSGKSTMARAMLGYRHLEADQFFVDASGQYRYDPSKVEEAHRWCQDNVRAALQAGEPVVVANTFTRLKELRPYQAIARDLGIPCRVIEATGRYANEHDVPASAVAQMRERWEELPPQPTTDADRQAALVDLVHSLLMSGAARWQVDDFIAHQARKNDELTPSKAAIDAAYAECIDRWLEDAATPTDEVYAYHIALRKNLINKASTLNDFPTAARIAQDLAKLQDQYADRRAARAAKPAREDRIARLRAKPPRLRAVK